MAETNFRTLLVAGTIFSILFFGIVNIMNLVNQTDSSFIPQSDLTHLNNSFDKLETQRNDIETMSTNLIDVEKTSSLGIISLPLAFLSSAWTSVKILFSSLLIIPELLGATLGYFGGTGWLKPFLITLIGIVTIFGILNFMFGRND